MTAALVALVEIHRVQFCAEGRGRCLDLAAGGVQVLVEYMEEAVWELVVDRVRLTGTAVERKGFVDYFVNPSSSEIMGVGLKCRNVGRLLDRSESIIA